MKENLKGNGVTILIEQERTAPQGVRIDLSRRVLRTIQVRVTEDKKAPKVELVKI